MPPSIKNIIKVSFGIVVGSALFGFCCYLVQESNEFVARHNTIKAECLSKGGYYNFSVGACLPRIPLDAESNP